MCHFGTLLTRALLANCDAVTLSSQRSLGPSPNHRFLRARNCSQHFVHLADAKVPGRSVTVARTVADIYRFVHGQGQDQQDENNASPPHLHQHLNHQPRHRAPGRQYANLFYLQGAFKPAIYGVKLKLEFVILNRLIKTISRHKMSSLHSDVRHGSESDAGINVTRAWNVQWPSSATEDERLKTPRVAAHQSS